MGGAIAGRLLGHFVLFTFAFVVAVIGWHMAHRPEKAYRFFTFGQREEIRIFVTFLKLSGWVFFVFFCLAAAGYLLLAVADLLRALSARYP